MCDDRAAQIKSRLEGFRMFAPALARRLPLAGVHYGWAVYLAACYIAGFACLRAGAAIWLIARPQSAHQERLVEARG